MVKICSFWDQNDVIGQKVEEKMGKFFFQNFGKKILGVGFPFAFSPKTPFSMLKCPKSAFFVIFGYFPIPFNREFYKITKPVHNPCSPKKKNKNFSYYFSGMYST